MTTTITHFLRDNRSLFVFLLLMSVFRSSLADWNDVPTGSMLPTIVQGDRILVNKAAYDLRIPFTGISLARHTDPLRGDIVVFESAVFDKRLVKRIIGMPGDVLEMSGNRLSINGQLLDYQLADNSLLESGGFIELQEDLLGLQHRVRIFGMDTQGSSFAPIRIPQGYYFAMGDNRDNSADSRVIGLIPRDEIIGRVRRVVMSLDYTDHYRPRAERFWRNL